MWQDFENLLNSSSVVKDITRAIEANKAKVRFELLNIGGFFQVPAIRVVLKEHLPKGVVIRQSFSGLNRTQEKTQSWLSL